ncbi:MAG: sensor histidine kinase [Promethearchaeota archaeon]
MNINELVEGIVNLLAIMFFIGGFGFSILIYRKKKSATKLLQIILFFIGSFYSLGEILEVFTTWYQAEEFSDIYELFLAIILLIIGITAFFEHKIRESEQKLYKQKIEENVIKEQVQKLKEIDQIRSDLVRRTSHELKTPLISIYTSSKYLLDTYKDELNEEILKLINVINRGGTRLKKMTENLLDAYDLESSRIELRKEQINITKTIKECINDFELSFKERQLFLKTDLDEDIYINIDKIRIENAILNLLSNAIKNTPPNGIIYVGLSKDKTNIDLIIKDTGIGFTEAEKDIAFKKFGKIERKIQGKDIITEGSGLGLFISNEIVKLHNGKILLESEGRDKGSTFIIRLPI